MTDSDAPAATIPLAARRSPAAHLASRCAATGGSDTVRLRELAFLTQVELRVDPAEEAVAQRLAAGFLDCPLPQPGQAYGGGRPYVLWLGPGWYLALDDSPEVTGWGLSTGLRAALGGEYGAACASVADVSAARTVLELSGPSARDVLAHGCPLDLHPRVFAPGHCTQTLLAKTGVALLQTDAAPTYRILVRTSYADHLTRWLLDAMTEYVDA